MRLAFDIDGCLADFSKSYAKALIAVTGRNLLPEGFAGDENLDFAKTWYWERELGYTKEEEEATWNQAILTSHDFWLDLAPLPGAAASLAQLNRLSKGNRVVFITHRMGRLVREQTELWLAKHGMSDPIVAITGDKAPFINAMGIDFFIDDKLQTIQDVVIKCPGTQHIYLKTAPYNALAVVEGAKRADSVEAALREAGLWMDLVKRPVGRPRKTSPSI